MNFAGICENLTVDCEGKVRVTFLTKNRNLGQEWSKLKGLDLTIEAKKFRQKRSLDANAYCWKLITEIANVLRADKEEVYIAMLKRYGQSEIVSVLEDIDVKPYFKYYEEVGQSMLNNKAFKHYKVFKGSSEFDTREMSILIDGIVSECKELGIETKTREELESMKEVWGT